MAEFFPPVLFEIKAKATEAIATFGDGDGIQAAGGVQDQRENPMSTTELLERQTIGQ